MSYFTSISKDMIFTARLHEAGKSIEKSPYNFMKFANYCYVDVMVDENSMVFRYKEEIHVLPYEKIERVVFLPILSPTATGEGSFAFVASIDCHDGNNITFKTIDLHMCRVFWDMLTKYHKEVVDEENLHEIWFDQMDAREARNQLNAQVNDHRSDYYVLSDEKKKFKKLKSYNIKSEREC